MRAENRIDGEEPRDLTQVAEEEKREAGSADERRKVENSWSASGTEDPAFFIKLSNGE